jgi:hypothetical protein
MDAVWERHSMCELAFNRPLTYSLSFVVSNRVPSKPAMCDSLMSRKGKSNWRSAGHMELFTFFWPPFLQGFLKTNITATQTWQFINSKAFLGQGREVGRQIATRISARSRTTYVAKILFLFEKLFNFFAKHVRCLVPLLTFASNILTIIG